MKTFVLSLGGSIIVPKDVNTTFLKNFKKLILKFSKSNRIIIVTGGGNLSRKYQQAAKGASQYDLDMIGIQATKVNAELVRSMFGKSAYEKIVDNPTRKINTNKRIIVGSGWKPGCSSDKDAVLLAKNFKADTVINLTNIDYVYDKDPRKYKNAKLLKDISWQDFLKIVGTKWSPGLNMPFDPIASRLAAKLKLRVVIANGKNLKNLGNILSNKKFKGTTIH